MLNKNELIIDRVRSAVAHDLADGHLLLRLTSIEEPSLATTAEGEEVVDALGSTITTLYRAKKATFSGANSLFAFDLAAAQFGAKKVLGTSENKITVPTYDILTVANGAVKTTKTPADATKIKYIYALTDGEIATSFVAGTVASATEFVINGTEITVPTGLTGKVYVEYTYESTDAVKVTNKTKEFPAAGSVIVYAYFKDKCNENLTYSGKIIAPKAKLDPSTIDLPLTSTGKHAFTYNILSDYCDEGGELFDIIVSQ
jgi:hypothetical protein